MRFKQFLEARTYDSEPFCYTPEELKALPAPSPSNIEHAYQVKGIAFNNEKGLGSTPMGQNVVYEGFVAFIPPSVFLKMAAKADRSEDIPRLKDYMKKGCPIATPFLEFKINPEFEDGAELEVTISGHEGRARIGAFGLLTDNTPLPVEFFPRNGLKARDLSEEFFKQFKKTMIKCQGGGYHYLTSVGDIYWKGQKL